jgi:serine/threonine-protein phosphatase 2A activator
MGVQAATLPPTIMSFQSLSKRILTPEQLIAFQQSSTHNQVIEYIEQLNESVKGAKLGDECPQSEVDMMVD